MWLGDVHVMTIYWSLGSVPELAALPSKQRSEVHEKCFRRYFLYAPATARSVASQFARILMMTSVFLIGNTALATFALPSGNFLCILALVSVGLPIGEFVSRQIAIPALRPFYHEFMEVNP